MKYFQFVWLSNPCDWLFGFYRIRYEDTDIALVYSWVLALGPLEIRKFNNDPNKFDIAARKDSEG